MARIWERCGVWREIDDKSTPTFIASRRIRKRSLGAAEQAQVPILLPPARTHHLLLTDRGIEWKRLLANQ